MTPLVVWLPGNERAAAALAGALACECAAVSVHRFPDGETSLAMAATLAGRDVAVHCTLDRPDDKLAALLFSASLARDLGAASVGLVAPYLAYMRQDMRFHRGESVTARYFSHLLSAHFDWLVTVDPHLHRIATLDAVYTVPAIAVSAAGAIGEWLRNEVRNPGLVGPDAESRQWVSAVAKFAGAPFTTLEKQRSGDHAVSVSAPDAAWLADCTPVIVDDIASTGRTLVAAAEAIRRAGAGSPCCVVVHPLFAGDAVQALARAGVKRIVSCDSVAHATNAIALDGGIAAAVGDMLGRMRERRSVILR